MKKISLLLFAMIIGLSGAFTQKTENSLLWKISGNGLEESSYLYGTLHILCPDQLDIKDKVKNALNGSDQLVMELNFNDPGVMAKIQQGMIYKDGTTASDYLNEKEYTMVSNFFRDSMNLPFQRLQAIKPFFLSSMITSHYLKCPQPASFEQKLTAMANENELAVKGLETVEEQLTVVEKISKNRQKDMLVEGIKNYEKTKKMFTKMVDHYLNEELSGLDEITEKYMSDEYAGTKEDLLIKRNKNWIKDMKPMMKKHRSFIAVGASHLTGKEGLINLLKDAGYTVEPII